MYIDHCRLIDCHNSFELYCEEELILSKAAVSITSLFRLLFFPIHSDLKSYRLSYFIDTSATKVTFKRIVIRYYFERDGKGFAT